MIISYIRTILVYLVLIGGMRLLGKRQIGQLEPSEFVVTMLIANLASIPLEDPGIPFLTGLVPILAVLGLELSLSGVTMRSVKLRRLLCGKPVIVIENGKLLQDSLRMTRVTLDELTAKLRQKDVLDLNTVQYAILETDGNLSVFLFPQYAPAEAREAGVSVKPRYLPVTIIEDGFFSRENLLRSGKDAAWLHRVLEEHRAKISDTFLLTVDQGGKVNWLGKEGGK